MSDINLRSYADVQDVEDHGPYPLVGNPAIHSDTLKFSNVQRGTVSYGEIWGGKEDCIDFNRGCQHITVWRTKLKSQGEYCCTIKDSSDISLVDVTVTGHGKVVDMDLGNWSDQGSDITRNVLLEQVRAEDDQPVVVRVLWAEPPTVIGGNVVVRGILPFTGTGKLNLAIVWLWRLGRKYKLWGTKA
jgi:hypothetical protein